MSEEAVASVEAPQPVAAPGGAEAGSPAVIEWKASLSEDLRNDPSLASINDVASLAKGYVHGQKMIGADKIVIPKDDASPDEMNEFYNRLGRPEKYEITKPQLAEGLEYNTDMETKMLGVLHEAGLSNAQANKVFAGYMDYIGNVHTENTTNMAMQREGWDKEIRQEFGKAYDERVDLAQRAAAEFGGEPFQQWLDDSGMGDHPMMIKMFAKIGQSMMESGIEPTGESSQFTLTPDAARQEIARLQRDPNFMKQDNDSEVDGHQQAIEKMRDLFAYAYPEDING